MGGKDMSKMKSRNWCFTLNNGDLEDIKGWKKDRIKLIIFQLEAGELSTEHCQGYLELDSPRALSWMKKLSPRCHWEARRGTKEEAMMYCIKEGRISSPWVWLNGEWKELLGDSPSREDLEELKLLKTKKKTYDEELLEVKKKFDEGSTFEEIADENFSLWCKHYRSFERYLLLKTTPRNHSVKVVIIQGPTGTGKSRVCMDRYPDGYWKQRSNWWDGYSGHSTIIIDEFYGWLPFDLLLRLCDRYPLMLETKGGQVQCVADTVVITSNKRPDEWYSSCYFASLARRVDVWMIMPEFGKTNIFNSWESAKDNFVTC